ncbi:hypothetical protein [Flavisolibacter tropicus]|uniref:DUF3300 domain-containing protein n=1 Tax=Flavisolibacter tropicus TaxID=1492898 RepID=A0A172TY98_9BACT|nr:hypothetical protein [Flavisolibacter tropicus]ANE52055.1 hypothetical protein SY85_17695 [Flavisolibacter tropicus]
MKKFLLPYLAAALSMLSLPAFAQEKEDTSAMLGMAGDNLDLYAVLDLFQKSKTIEAFEKSLNDEKSKINNLDLNLDKKIDFIKVVTKKNGDSYSFILQVDVSKSETQDVAVILLDKDKDKKVSLQIVGDEDLYGKDYVIEPKGNSSVTANPGYTGDNPVTVNVPAQTTVVVQSAPIVQYVYSPAYVPYVPPYHYGYYPPWFGFATVMAVGIYRSNHYYHHHGYYGGHYGGGNTVVINNNNNFNNYNSNRNRSTTVANNNSRNSYGNGSGNRGGNNRVGDNRAGNNRAGDNRAGNNRVSTSDHAANGPSDRAGNRASASDRGSASNRPSASTRQSPSTSTRQPTSTRQSPSYSSPSPRSSSTGGGRSMGGGRSSGGGGRSMGGGRRG